jgi:hypothetical protein
VNLADKRMRAYVEAELQSLQVVTTSEPWSRDMAVFLLLLDHVGERTADLADFLGADPSRRAIILNGAAVGAPDRQVVLLGQRPPVSRIRQVLHEAVRARTGKLAEMAT